MVDNDSDISKQLSIFSDEENEENGNIKQNDSENENENENDKLNEDINDSDIEREYKQFKKDNREADNLSDISELSDLEPKNIKKQEPFEDEDDDDLSLNNEVQFKTQKRNEYEYDDDDDDEYDYGDQQANSQKRKRKSEKKSRKRNQDDIDELNNKNDQPQESKKDQKQRKLQDQGNVIFLDLKKRMEKALNSDLKSKKLNRPALKRVKLIDEVEKKLRNEYVRDAFFDQDGMKTLHDWLVSSNNNINLRKRILVIVKNLKIHSFEEIEAQVRHFIEMKSRIQNKDPNALKLDTETRRLYIDIVDSWGAAIAKL